MKKILEKSICMVLTMCMVITVMVFDVDYVKADIVKEDTFEVSYDKTKYSMWWISRENVTVRSQHDSLWGVVSVDDKLGTATIRGYYLEPKTAQNGYYYAITGWQISMDPDEVSSNISGMSQLAEIEVKTPNEDSRVCSPTVSVLEIQAKKTESSSGNFTAGTGVKYNNSTKSWEASAEFGFGATWGASSTYEYNMTNVILTQKNKNGNYASWQYDYKSKDGNATWNAYLCSSSAVAGQVVYRLSEKPTDSNRITNIPAKVRCDIRFGAGNPVTGKVEGNWWNGVRDLGVVEITITLNA